MSDLATTYMGLTLKNPIVPSASPLSCKLDDIQKMADAGAGAIVLFSLFEEQMAEGAPLLDDIIEDTRYRYAESIDFFPELGAYRCNETQYLDLIYKAKAAIDIPIIASLNGHSEGSWVRYARQLQEAGADALELNLYYLPTSHRLTGAQIESMYFSVLHDIRRQVSLPIAVKLHPFITAIPHMAQMLDCAGANGLVLFNRFYEPDLDIEGMTTRRSITLSTSAEIRLPLRWVAILHGQIAASLALSTGVHTPADVIKAVMVGADVVQVCSVLLNGGIEKIGELIAGTAMWLDEHGYTDLGQIRGLLSLRNSPSPAAYERANYVKLIGQ
ncbi:MAG TPA: dihydroorotate dehydrogenase-like protein [Anaerolineae bacterium]|nr:dihydroorotate dehydrogenase-like protein [Anaerolineae bacterium]